MTRQYAQGMASLGFHGGPSMTFRLNPDAVDWNFQINTAVIETVGGRVVQVLGANLSDLTIKGSFGERRSGGTHTPSWEMAEQFLSQAKAIADYQSNDAERQGRMHEPAVLSFPPKGWRFHVYLKSLVDTTGSSAIAHSPGKFAYDYVLTLSIFDDLSDTSRVIGSGNGDLKQAADKAIASYIGRIADGIGWKVSDFNGPSAVAGVISDSTAPKQTIPTTGSKSKSAPVTRGVVDPATVPSNRNR